MKKYTVRLKLRSQYPTQDNLGRNIWKTRYTFTNVPATKIAILICDMWDKHWSKGATDRISELIIPMERLIYDMRKKGALIIHSPSDVIDCYVDYAARERVLKMPTFIPPKMLSIHDAPLPISDSNNTSDTGEITEHVVWTRQHPGLKIDNSRDIISADGSEIYNALQVFGCEWLLFMGVHTNMCLLDRSFSIKQMARWGVKTALIRDLTDAMYNPFNPPYISHDSGTQLVVGYIEKFWCPTILSSNLK